MVVAVGEEDLDDSEGEAGGDGGRRERGGDSASKGMRYSMKPWEPFLPGRSTKLAMKWQRATSSRGRERLAGTDGGGVRRWSCWVRERFRSVGVSCVLGPEMGDVELGGELDDEDEASSLLVDDGVEAFFLLRPLPSFRARRRAAWFSMRRTMSNSSR